MRTQHQEKGQSHQNAMSRCVHNTKKKASHTKRRCHDAYTTLRKRPVTPQGDVKMRRQHQGKGQSHQKAMSRCVQNTKKKASHTKRRCHDAYTTPGKGSVTPKGDVTIGTQH